MEGQHARDIRCWRTTTRRTTLGVSSPHPPNASATNKMKGRRGGRLDKATRGVWVRRKGDARLGSTFTRIPTRIPIGIEDAVRVR